MSSLRVVERPVPPPFRQCPAAVPAVMAARVLARVSPRRIRGVLELVRRGAAPATYEQARAAREAVVATSVLCAGEGCLQRALATALLCRLCGVWPTWCTGVRTAPFTAHAWVEVDGEPVDEPHPPGYHHPIITIPPVPNLR